MQLPIVLKSHKFALDISLQLPKLRSRQLASPEIIRNTASDLVIVENGNRSTLLRTYRQSLDMIVVFA